MPGPTKDEIRKTYPSGEGGTQGDVVENAMRRTDNSYAGRKNDEKLIGEDIPRSEQDEEADEWGETS